MADTPIKYIVKEKSLIGNELFEAGAEVVLPEGTLPAENLQPICERGEAKHQEYLASNAARVAKMKEQFATDAMSSNTALAEAISIAVVKAMAAQKAEFEANFRSPTQAEVEAEREAYKARVAELEAQAKAALA